MTRLEKFHHKTENDDAVDDEEQRRWGQYGKVIESLYSVTLSAEHFAKRVFVYMAKQKNSVKQNHDHGQK